MESSILPNEKHSGYFWDFYLIKGYSEEKVFKTFSMKKSNSRCACFNLIV